MGAVGLAEGERSDEGEREVMQHMKGKLQDTTHFEIIIDREIHHAKGDVSKNGGTTAL